MKEQSPCLTCTMVENPKNCERKGCAAWQKWWLARWENMRSRYCAEIKRAKENEDDK